jgi:hypothetical protein
VADILMLPKPRRREGAPVVPVPLYGIDAQLFFPEDMTEAEARKIANVVLAYGKLTPFNARRA